MANPSSGSKRPKAPVGAAAVAELKKQVSPYGMKKSAEAQKSAIDKKYPGLYKKKTTSPKKFK
jgi:hypothetical protein